VLLDLELAVEMGEAGASLGAVDGRVDEVLDARRPGRVGDASRPRSQKLPTLKTPSAPSMARSSELLSSRSPCTTSAPPSARARAAGLFGSRAKARTRNPFFRRCRAVAPPCWPVAPVTRMVFVFLLSLVIMAARTSGAH
jgi:hypothetical protein